jgi:hypothetical protein
VIGWLLFFLAFLAYALAAAGSFWWTYRAQIDYLRSYRSTHDLEIPVDPQDLQDLYMARPWRLLMDGPGLTVRTLRALHSRAAEPDLEARRRRYLRRRTVAYTITIFGFLVVMLLTITFGWGA